MKTALIILGVLFALVLALVAGGFGYLAYEGKQCDASSKAYVDESIPAIVSNWSKDELVKRVSPELLQATSDDDLSAMFGKLSGLGPMQSYGGSVGEAKIHVTRAAKLQITAAYAAQATFPKGKAIIKLNLMQVNGAWTIASFSVGPAAPAK
jgi:hypothetical protein